MSQPQETQSGLAGKLKAAGQYALKQAEKKKLETITLPSAYRALGKHLYSSGTFKDEFPAEFAAVSGFAKQIKDIQEHSGLRPAAEGMADKAKAAAVGAKEAAQTKGLQIQISQACGRLGSAVYGKHAESSGSTELVTPIANALSRITTLDSEIQQLSKVAVGNLLTPKRIVIAGLTVVVAMVAIVALLLWAGHKAGGFGAFASSKSNGWGGGVQVSGDSGSGTSVAASTDPSELKGLSTTAIKSKLGEPSLTWTHPSHANMHLYGWDAGNDKYIVIWEIETLDGSGRDIVEVTENKISKYRFDAIATKFENLK